MARALALLIAVLFLAMQKGDGDPLRIKAFVCEKEGRDYCGKRQRQGFEPARVRIEVYLAQHPENRAIGYGLDCDGFIVAESRGELDGHADPPMLFVEHRDMGAGFCVALAKLARSDGTILQARSEPIRILALEN